MERTRRDGDATVIALYLTDLLVLRRFLLDLLERIAPDDADEPADAFDAWERSLQPSPEDVADVDEDPVLRRLLPNAYVDDDRASADFRRYTEREQRLQRVREGGEVADALGRALTELARASGADGPGPLSVAPDAIAEVRVPDAAVGAWLRALNGLRLALAVDLGINDADDADAISDLDEDDERVLPAAVYELCGFLESLLIDLLPD